MEVWLIITAVLAAGFLGALWIDHGRKRRGLSGPMSPENPSNPGFGADRFGNEPPDPG